MKKTFVIVSSILIVAFAGFLIWKSTFQNYCDSKCDYNNKMAMVCQLSCAAEDVNESKIVAQSKARVGDFTKCPISGVVFKITEESSKISYGDMEVFTCCQTCVEIFNQSPQDYISNIN